MTKIRYALGNENIEDMKILFKEYSKIEGAEVCFVSFERELENLQKVYAPPKGIMLIVYDDNMPIGCVAIKAFDDNACDMKRLYVRPDYRGRGIATKLIQNVLKVAKEYGYKKIFLETLPEVMKEAVSLYNRLGFIALSNTEGILRMEKELDLGL